MHLNGYLIATRNRIQNRHRARRYTTQPLCFTHTSAVLLPASEKNVAANMPTTISKQAPKENEQKEVGKND
jgi:hypothetical protein